MTTPLSIHEPSSAPKGAVVVIQEAFGVNEHIEDVSSRLADAGWLAVAPHMFHRTGDPKFGYDDFSVIGEHMMALNPDSIAEDVDAALDHIEAAGFGASATGIVGFCMGGTVALWAATTRPLGAAVTYYGGGVAASRFGLPSLIEAAPNLKAPWLGLYGDLDKGIPVEEVEQLRAAVATSSLPTELVRYADADHGFNCDRRASFHAESATDAWQRMLDWFDTYLARP